MDLKTFLEIAQKNPLIDDAQKEHLFLRAPFMLAWERAAAAQAMRQAEEKLRQLEARRQKVYRQAYARLEKIRLEELPKVMKVYEGKMREMEAEAAEKLVDEEL
jgi:shikimate kinase